MITIVIEDEKPAARRLVRMLDELNVPVEATLHSVQESIAWLQSNAQPDLIFLDIQLSDGLSFEIFEQVEVQSKIIFTTAYDEYALQAFKLNSVDYLLKPIDDEDLEHAVNQYKQQQEPTVNTSIFEDIKKMLVNPAAQHEYKERFTAKVGQHLKVFNVDEAALFYSENKGTYINTIEGRNYLLDTKLEALVDVLDPKKFFRVSRKYIIAHKYIDDIIDYSNSRLKIKVKTYQEDEIIVSRERVRDFKNWLNS